MEKKITHGGQRKGAGRPAKNGPHKYYSLYLKIEHMDLIIEKKSEFVREAIKDKLIAEGLLK